MLLIIILCISLFTGCPPGPVKPVSVNVSGKYNYGTAIVNLDNTINTAINKYKLDGLAVAVVDEGNIIFEKCYGCADRKRKSRIAPNTCFRTGTVGETLTALAIVKLAGEGKIDLAAPVSSYIPGLSFKTRFEQTNQVTVKNLLTHSSGITANYWPGWMSDTVQTEGEIKSIINNDFLNFQPGTATQYSSLDYSLLGMIIENVTGKDFNKYMCKELLKPLNMEESSFLTNPSINHYLSTGYLGDQAVSNLDIRDKPSLNLYSTLSDMTAYLKYLVSSKNSNLIINEEQFNGMLENDKNDNYIGQKLDFGFGWTLRMYPYKNENIISRSGDIPGYACEIAFSFDRKIGIVVLGNSTYAGLAKYYIVSLGFKKFLEVKKGSSIEVDEILNDKNYNADSSVVQGYTGKYCSMNLINCDIFQRNGGLYGNIFGQEFILRPFSEGFFSPYVNIFGELDPAGFLEAKKIYIEFYKNSAGRDFMAGTLIFGYTPLKFVMSKVEKSDIPENYKNYTGNWVIQEGKYKIPYYIFPKNLTINFSIEDGWAKLKLYGRDIAVLNPVDDVSAEIFGSGDMIRMNKDSLSLLGMKFKRKK